MEQETKVCSKCGLEKPISVFCIVRKSTGARRRSCNPCEAARIKAYYEGNATYRARSKERAAQWAKDNPERNAIHTKRAHLKYKYGLTPERVDVMLAAQGGGCALCGSKDHGRTGNSGRHDGSRKWLAKSWNVDHCHTTGKVRGLLCHTCNIRVGAYEFLMNTIGRKTVLDYLERSPLGLPNVNNQRAEQTEALPETSS